MNTAQRFKERILHTYFVRCDMSLILLVVVASGVGASKLLLECGLHSLQWRYPLAMLVSFIAFLLLVRVWIWYVFCRKTIDLTSANFDGVSGGDGATPRSFHFGGGDSGGGGATGSWGEDIPAKPAAGGSSSSGGGGGSGFDLGFGDDWAIILLLGALVLAIVCAGGYLIYVAPHILPEAAWQATLASGLARVSKPTDRENWLAGVLRASSIPFAAVLVLVVALGWVAHHHCPQAAKLAEALYCAGR
jgi:hypothetical protein